MLLKGDMFNPGSQYQRRYPLLVFSIYLSKVIAVSIKWKKYSI